MSKTRTVTAEIFGTKKTTLSDFAGFGSDSSEARKVLGSNGKSGAPVTGAPEPTQYQSLNPLDTYVSIPGFSRLTNFPEHQIRALVARNAIPYLKTGPKVLLHVRDVMECLSKLAMEHTEINDL